MTLAVADVRTAFEEYADTNAFPDAVVQAWITQVGGLRAAFPEFSSATTYPDLTVVYWISIASIQISPARFGASLPLAIRLYAAHNIILAALAAQKSASGAIVGGPDSLVASKSIGAVSVSYDTRDSSIEGAGQYNDTQYGQRFWQLLKQFSVGPFYVVSPRAVGPWGRSGFRPF